jgi:Cu/Ag efflux protein CusF
MKATTLIIALALPITTPVMAEDYSDLRPGYKSSIQAPPENLGKESMVTHTVTILAVNHHRKMLTYQAPDGVTKTIVADDADVLKQLKPGDKADVTLYKGSSVELVDPNDMEGEVVSARDAKLKSTGSDGTPIVAKGTGIGVMVKINTVDPYKKTIRYTLPGQQPKEISMNTPHLLPYLKKLKDGDTVEMIFVEARAAKIVPRH